ncbi:hypothetical protein GBAR_LOCUS22138, partial [Geodia barretti]
MPTTSVSPSMPDDIGGDGDSPLPTEPSPPSSSTSATAMTGASPCPSVLAAPPRQTTLWSRGSEEGSYRTEQSVEAPTTVHTATYKWRKRDVV